MTLRLGAIYGGGFTAMELTAILNRCHGFRGFVYEHAGCGSDKQVNATGVNESNTPEATSI